MSFRKKIFIYITSSVWCQNSAYNQYLIHFSVRSFSPPLLSLPLLSLSPVSSSLNSGRSFSPLFLPFCLARWASCLCIFFTLNATGSIFRACFKWPLTLWLEQRIEKVLEFSAKGCRPQVNDSENNNVCRPKLSAWPVFALCKFGTCTCE